MKVLVTQSCSTLCDPMTVAFHALLPMEFFIQEYWSWLPLPSPGHLPDAGVTPRSPALQADSLLSEPPRKIFFFRVRALLLRICGVVHKGQVKKKERKKE